MSREVLGVSAASGRPGSQGDASPGPAVVAASTVVTDLDAPVRPAPGRPDRQRARERTPDAQRGLPTTTPPPPGGRRTASAAWLWGPPGLAASAVLALVVGALLGAGAVERNAAARRAASVHLVGGLSYAAVGIDGSSEGAPSIDVDLQVINVGPEAVRVTAAGFEEGPAAADLVLDEPFEVASGENATQRVRLTVDCDEPLLADLVATVTTLDGRSRQVTVEPTGLPGYISSDDLGFVCSGFGGGGQGSAVEVFSTAYRGDGVLSLQVRNTRDRPVVVAFGSPAGTRIVSDPEAPLSLEAGESTLIVLRAEVEQCTTSAMQPDAGAQVVMTVDAHLELGLDPVLTAGWLAREVALACP